ncbi:MAG: outer membrane lipoprotein carrier protein LolA [Traorella sp.]
MLKKKYILIGLVVIVFLGCVIIFRPKSFAKKADEVFANLTSYTLKGEMEINKGDDIKNYMIEVYYQANETNPLFKVSLFDKNLNQEQVLLRNKEGVFVITPSLNQIFKFEGDWPLNSPKPYLIQTMVDLLKQEDTIIESTSEGTLVKSNINYPNNKTYKYEEILFDKDSKPISVHIYDENKTIQLQIVFSNVEYNQKLDDKIFESPQDLESSVNGISIQKEDLPLYPSMVYNSNLTNQSTYEINGELRHILEYQGEKNFTVTQTLKTPPNQTYTVFKSGELIDMVEMVGFYDGVSCLGYYQNIEMNVYSNDLSVDEMMSVLSSLQVAVMK